MKAEVKRVISSPLVKIEDLTDGLWKYEGMDYSYVFVCGTVKLFIGKAIVEPLEISSWDGSRLRAVKDTQLIISF